MLNNRGSVLYISLLFMVVLSLIGFAGVMNSITEISIGKNYRLAREAFYPSDGGLEILNRAIVKVINNEDYAPQIANVTIIETSPRFFEAVLYPACDNSGCTGNTFSIDSTLRQTGTLFTAAATTTNATNLIVTRLAPNQIVGRGHCIGGSIIFGDGEFCQPYILQANTDISSQANSNIEEIFMIHKYMGF